MGCGVNKGGREMSPQGMKVGMGEGGGLRAESWLDFFH